MKYYHKGDDFELSASNLNALNAVIRKHKYGSLSRKRGAPAKRAKTTFVDVHNYTEEDFDAYTVVMLIEPTFPLDKNLNSFLFDTVMDVEIFDEDTNLVDSNLNFAVLLSPLKSGERGKAVTEGMIPMLIELDVEEGDEEDPDDQYAELVSGETIPLSSGDGPFEIMWKQDKDTVPEEQTNKNIRWALVRFPITQGGERIKIINDSGETIPEGGCMMLEKVEGKENTYNATKPDRTFLSNVMPLYGKPLEDGKSRSVPILKFMKALMDPDESDVYRGDKVGSQEDKWEWTGKGFKHIVTDTETETIEEVETKWATIRKFDGVSLVRGTYPDGSTTMIVNKVISGGVYLNEDIEVNVMSD